MGRGKYHKLKTNKGTVTVKVEEVLIPIFAKGLLTRREMQIVCAIIADSWRWRNSQFTQRPVSLRELAKAAGLDYANVTRIWKSLIERGIIILKPDGRASFNEHFESWLPSDSATVKTTNPKPKLSKRQPKVVKSTTKTVKTTTRSISNELRDNALLEAKNTYKNNLKNNNTPPDASRRENYESNALKQAIVQKFSRDEKPSKIGLALKRCRTADLHPIDLVNRADNDWFGYITAACRSPDKDRDSIRSFHSFSDAVTPIDPEVRNLIEKTFPKIG